MELIGWNPRKNLKVIHTKKSLDYLKFIFHDFKTLKNDVNPVEIMSIINNVSQSLFQDDFIPYDFRFILILFNFI